MLTLDDQQLYRALRARDPRFDGIFFVGVTSTRVYCRPVCTATTPRADRCRFFVSAAAAERRGFRPCLRCRPELAPGDSLPSSVDAMERLARAAATRIAAGALDRGSIDDLAAELGVSARHVRRAVERELGATPVELAQTRRLLTAKQLLTETHLPLTRIALASGFRSVRRFNALFQSRYRLSPSHLRRKAVTRVTSAPADTVSLSLSYRPPYDWSTMLAYLAARATPGVEFVDMKNGSYWKSVRLDEHQGWILVRHATPTRRTRSTQRPNALKMQISAGLVPVFVPLLSRVRRLFDLDAEPSVIDAHLSTDPTLVALVARRPGLRVSGAIDGFDLALRAVLGQQVSVRGASTLAGRLASLAGEPLEATPNAPIERFPVRAERLAAMRPSHVSSIGLTKARAECLVALARATAAGSLPELASGHGDPSSLMRRLEELPGIGPWTAQYVAMRALGWPDAFPESDLGLRKAMDGISAARLRAAAERWRPWRAYAAQHLWASLGDANGAGA
jgi:AraC family transcriptional regulator, regulatory protein of adaptative response / DNA-3-methyladenine glycosylase II